MIGVFLALAGAERPRRAPALPRGHHGARVAWPGTWRPSRTGGASAPLAGDRGVGTFGGSEDHTAILCCRAGDAEPVPLRAGRASSGTSPCRPTHVFVVAFSGVLAEKTGGGAGDLQPRVAGGGARARDLAGRRAGRPAPTLEAAGDGGAGRGRRPIRRGHRRVGRRRRSATHVLLKRFDQFVLESRRIVPAAGDALAPATSTRFGALVDRSQEAAERWLGNQVPGDGRARARGPRPRGARAASAFGAGFGGSVWALVRRGRRAVRSSRSGRLATRSASPRPRPGARVLRNLRRGRPRSSARGRAWALRRPAATGSWPSAPGSPSCRCRAPESPPPR